MFLLHVLGTTDSTGLLLREFVSSTAFCFPCVEFVFSSSDIIKVLVIPSSRTRMTNKAAAFFGNEVIFMKQGILLHYLSSLPAKFSIITNFRKEFDRCVKIG